MNMRDFYIACLQQATQQQAFWTFDRIGPSQKIKDLSINPSGSPKQYFTIDWGDGTTALSAISATNGVPVSHTYTQNGRMAVRIIPNNATPSIINRITCSSSEAPRIGGIVDVSAFINLTSLNISNQDITKIQGFEIISTLTNLQVANNKINQPISNLALNRSGNLKAVSIAGNLFKGSIPIDLPPLETFNCSQNDLSGPIPSSLPASLISFNCSDQSDIDGKISGSIPNISHLINLEAFNCNSNRITGFIPALNNLTNLKIFSCSNNILSGNIPSLNNLINLESFTCNTNRLSGIIPNLSNCLNLNSFTCLANRLSGDIPDMSNLDNLRVFSCANNSISGVYMPFTVRYSLSNFNASNNGLSETAVNSILIALCATGRVGAPGGIQPIVNLAGGNNAAPTGNGLLAKDVLIGRYWNVSVK